MPIAPPPTERLGKTVTPKSVVVAVATVVLCTLPFWSAVPNAKGEPWLTELHNVGHTLMFIPITLGLLSILATLLPQIGLFQRVVISFFATMAIGGLIELAQRGTARTASWHDWLLDLAGVAIALIIYLSFSRRRPWGWRATGLVCVLGIAAWVFAPTVTWWMAKVVQQQAFPSLWAAEHPITFRNWKDVSRARVSFVTPPAHLSLQRNTVIRVTLPAEDKLPGWILKYSPHDWSGYSKLVLKTYHSHASPIKFGVNFYSYANTSFETVQLDVSVVTIAPGLTEVSIPLEDKPKFNIERVKSVAWHALELKQPATVFVESVELHR